MHSHFAERRGPCSHGILHMRASVTIKKKGCNFMKRGMVVLLGAAMVVSGGLSVYGNPEVITQKEKNETVKTQSEDAVEELKTGLAIVTSIGKSADAGEIDGTVQTDMDVAAVVVDSEGRIVDCTIDSLQTTVQFDGEGKITTDLAAEFLTKQELGEQYGLKGASSIGKEWNEQADAFAEYCIGKTAQEISGIAVTEEGQAEDEDLAASCTINFGGFQELVVKAVANAE